MNRQLHEYSAEQWVDFVEGSADKAAAASMRDHIGSCDPCRRTYEDLMAAHARLEDLSLRMNSFTAGKESSARIRHAVLARIRIAQAASAGESIAVGVDQLRSILKPLCGAATTEVVIRNAALSCEVADTDRMARHEWQPFVKRLGSIVDTLCGASVARWIWETARDIQWEDGA
jgi:hypothetical protein